MLLSVFGSWETSPGFRNKHLPLLRKYDPPPLKQTNKMQLKKTQLLNYVDRDLSKDVKIEYLQVKHLFYT